MMTKKNVNTNGPRNLSLAWIAWGIVIIAGCSDSSLRNSNATTMRENRSADKSLNAPAASDPHEPVPPFYSVGHYDEKRDPATDLADTLKRAETEQKRVLLQVGGDWCGWCRRISQFMHTNAAVRELLEDHFVVMKVTHPGDYADRFLSQFPKCNGYPHFFVLESDGTLLHSQNTGDLEKGEGYDQDVFVTFLTAWKDKS